MNKDIKIDRPGPGLSRSKAFTLVEVLVASSIICIFAASFVFMAAVAVKQEAASRQLTRSLFACKSAMEDLRSRDFGALMSFNNMTFDSGKGIIMVTSAGNDRISIMVRDKVELNTIRSRY